MNRIFVIGDTHFGHRKVLEFEKINRPFATIEEHDEELVARWNKVVRKGDTVWHLGDVLFGTDAFKYLPRLHGIKKLVMGNHDMYPTARYLEHFSSLVGAVKIKDCILTHIPIHPSEFYRWKLNIHGHTHGKKIDDKRYVCVSAEHTNLAPVELDRLIAERS